MPNGGGGGGSGGLAFKEAPVSDWGLERLAEIEGKDYFIYLRAKETLTYASKTNRLSPYGDREIPKTHKGEIIGIIANSEAKRISRMIWYPRDGDKKKAIAIGTDGEEGLDKLIVTAIIASEELVKLRYKLMTDMVLATGAKKWERVRECNGELEGTFIPDNHQPRFPRTEEERKYERCMQACLRAFANPLVYDRYIQEAEDIYDEIVDPNPEE